MGLGGLFFPERQPGSLVQHGHLRDSTLTGRAPEMTTLEYLKACLRYSVSFILKDLSVYRGFPIWQDLIDRNWRGG
jgi:hypothetical protein